MAEAAPVVGYASTGAEEGADRFLRRVVGLAAIAYAGLSVAGAALFTALAWKWVASPTNMMWALNSRAEVALQAVAVAVTAALGAGGVLLLRRWPGAVLMLRLSAGGVIAVAVTQLVETMVAVPMYSSAWSTPATAAMNTLGFVHQQWFPVMILLLTLPPLGRRMA